MEDGYCFWIDAGSCKGGVAWRVGEESSEEAGSEAF